MLRKSLLWLHPALATPTLVAHPLGLSEDSSLRQVVARIRRPAVVSDRAAAVAELSSLQSAAQELTSIAQAWPCPRIAIPGP